jgi:hypothetical protein
MVGTASLSGDINDNRTLFHAVGFAIAARVVATDALADSPPVLDYVARPLRS